MVQPLRRHPPGELKGEAMSSDKLVSLSFRTYLAQRAKRYGPGDELITALTRDDLFAAIRSRQELDAYLTRCGISRNGQFYADQLWKNYIAANKRQARFRSLGHTD
jgi:hypothetical protein